jgi:hypothetical protein
MATDWIEDVVAFLDANSTALRTGENLFADAMPDDSPKIGLSVFEVSSLQGSPTYSGDGFARPTISVIARSTAPADGASMPNPRAARHECWNAYRRLASVANQPLTTSGRVFGAITPLGVPVFTDVDEQGRVRYSFDADVWLTVSTGAM